MSFTERDKENARLDNTDPYPKPGRDDSRERSVRKPHDEERRRRHHHRRHRRSHSRSRRPNSRSRSRSPRRDYYDPYDGRQPHRRYNDRPHHPYPPHRNGNYDGDRRPEDRPRDYRPRRDEPPPRSAPPLKPIPEYRVVNAPKDDKLGQLQDDPRGEDPAKRITQKASSRGAGRNTESFDPASTLVRPDLRVQVGSNRTAVFKKPLKHDDVVIVPELFGAEDDWSLYYKLVEEMREIQAKGDVKGSEWISWHEGAHLICKNPTGSETFNKIVDRLCEYFNIRKESVGTRFNWYRDSSDWKPQHHDSAAFNPQRARNQNITVGVSFGATRELAFYRAEPLQNEEKVKIYFPQTNNGVFSFGRDANILWKHGVNALPSDQQDGKGRISIILWGLAQNVIEETGSPPLLGSDGHGPHASQRKRHGQGYPHRNNKGGRHDGGDRRDDRQ